MTAALEEVVPGLAAMETEWDEQKLSQKLSEYFTKCVKHMNFKNKGIDTYISEYADLALGTVFAGLGDREWLYSGQGDLSMLLLAGVKDYFPKWLLKKAPEDEVQTLVALAYERVFDEQRCGPIISETVPLVVSGPKIKKKVWNAMFEGRKVAATSGTQDAEEFTQMWIDSAVKDLSENSLGNPALSMEIDQAVKLFVSCLEGSGLPLSLQTVTPSPPVHVVEAAVAAAYAEHTRGEDDPMPVKKKPRWGAGGGGGGKKSGGGTWGSMGAW